MCSSGGDKYDTAGPASFNGTNAQSGSFFSLVSQSHQQNPNLFDPSPNYLHAVSQAQPAASIPNHEPNYCTHLPDPPLSSSLFASNQSAAREHNNAVRNSKKRSRASRRAPTTVITTDTSNFRSMVREFTGIPAPPSSAASHPRRFHTLQPHLRHLHPPNPSENVIDPMAPTTTSHQILPDLGLAFQAPLHLPLPMTFSSTSQPSGSEWPSRF